MEIEITSLLELDQFPLSHSAAEGGQNAGRETWQAALEQAKETPLLDTPEKLQAMRDFARSSGGWDDEEIAAWTCKELNALFLQWIAGDCRECPMTLEGITFEERELSESRREGAENGFDGARFIDAGTLEWFYSSEDEPDMETGPFDSRSEAYQDACIQGREPRADSLDEIDWQEYEFRANAGRISGNLFRANDDRIYFNLGN